MAKRKKKRKLKKQYKAFFSFIFFSAFLLLIFGLFTLGRQYLQTHFQDLPPNSQHLKPTALGIDVSEWQENIDWQKVKADGYSFAIIRTSFGVEGKIDAKVIEHIEGAKEAGLNVGAYHYSHATTVNEAIKEADDFIALLDLYRWDFPVYYDVETDRQDHLSQDELTAIVKAFLERVSDAGYEAGIYASQYWLEYRLDMEQLADYEVWIASYANQLNYDGSFEMWQYTKNGTVSGIDGNVDINVAYYDYPSHMRRVRKNNY